MNGDEIDDLLRDLPSNGAHDPVDPVVLSAIRKPILADVTPVRPLPSTAALALLFCIFFGVVAAVGSHFLGFAGLRRLSLPDCVLVCGVLLVLAVAAAIGIARDMRPGDRRLPGWLLLCVALAVFEVLFFFLLRNYQMDHFVPLGMICLRVGLLWAAPAALVAYLLLRRGYVVSPVSTGATVGLGAGLVGLAVIEFHCPIETFPHVAVWHVGIFVVSTAVGAFFGALGSRFTPRV
jgi:hypothetical protein